AGSAGGTGKAPRPARPPRGPSTRNSPPPSGPATPTRPPTPPAPTSWPPRSRPWPWPPPATPAPPSPTGTLPDPGLDECWAGAVGADEVAGDEGAGRADRAEGRYVDRALGDGHRAAGVEPAARRRIDRARDVAGEHDPAAAALGRRVRDRGGGQ